MHIIYAVTGCSDGVYRRLFANQKKKPAFQSQKYHRLMIEGLAAHCRVDVVANPPVNRSVLAENVIRLPEETEGGANYQYISAYRNPVRKLFHVFFGTFFRTFRLADRDGVVVVDCLNRAAALAAMLAARLRRRPCVGIVTDLPDMFRCGRFSKACANFVIRRCTHHVLLTQAMHEYLSAKHGIRRPYVVLEGHADIGMEQMKPGLEKKTHPRMCLYAGLINREYGIADLVEGFRLADIPNARLRVYGSGDYEGELREIAGRDPRVEYGGTVLSSEVVEKEMEATLLVNPRPTREEYVKYSFPSKTMEYMASGTPVLTTKLPGMPEDYYPYVFFIQEETAEGIAAALKKALELPESVLFARGLRARSFVLEERNNVVQAGKLMKMLGYREGARK